jgi:hypothetical protein
MRLVAWIQAGALSKLWSPAPSDQTPAPSDQSPALMPNRASRRASIRAYADLDAPALVLRRRPVMLASW